MIIDSLTKDISLVSAEDCLIIPDVHGRDFWKDAANRFPGNIVFLGDYLDPYPLEGISPDEAFTNFQEILSFKKANPDRVTLLLGNHDLQYFSKAYSLYRNPIDILGNMLSYMRTLSMKTVSCSSLPILWHSLRAKSSLRTPVCIHAGLTSIRTSCQRFQQKPSTACWTQRKVLLP